MANGNLRLVNPRAESCEPGPMPVKSHWDGDLRRKVVALINTGRPNGDVTVASIAEQLRLQKAEDAERGYEVMRGQYERRIYPDTEGLRYVIQLLGKTNENIRRLKAEDLVDDRILRRLEKEGLF